jgi:hypothetical protein
MSARMPTDILRSATPSGRKALARRRRPRGATPTAKLRPRRCAVPASLRPGRYRLASQSCFVCGPARTSMWGRSPAGGSPITGVRSVRRDFVFPQKGFRSRPSGLRPLRHRSRFNQPSRGYTNYGWVARRCQTTAKTNQMQRRATTVDSSIDQPSATEADCLKNLMARCGHQTDRTPSTHRRVGT